MSTPSPSNLPNEQATPRTDAATYDSQPDNPMITSGTYVVSAEFARTLERELTAAQAQVAKLTEERDEANSRSEAWYLVANKFGDKSCPSGVSMQDYVLDRIDSLRAQVADLTRSLEAKQGLVERSDAHGQPILETRHAAKVKVIFDIVKDLHPEVIKEEGATILHAIALELHDYGSSLRSTQPAQSTAQGTEELAIERVNQAVREARIRMNSYTADQRKRLYEYAMEIVNSATPPESKEGGL